MNRFKRSIKNTISTLILMIWIFSLYSAEENKNFISDADYFNPRINLKTPHISWANPYAKGPIKALFIIPRTGTREAIEIAQRLEMKYDIFATDTCSRLTSKRVTGCDPEGSHAKAQEQRLCELARKKYDIILIGGVEWKILPLEIRYFILKQVKAGTGLLGIIPAHDEYFAAAIKNEADKDFYEKLKKSLSGFPFKETQGFEKENSLDEFIVKNLSFYSFGNGKICLLKYPQGAKSSITRGPYHPFVQGVKEEVIQTDCSDYDFQLGLVLKCILWAEKNKSELILHPENAQISCDLEKGLPCKTDFVIENLQNPFAAKGEFFILDDFGVKLYSRDLSIEASPKNNKIPIEIPRLPIGSYRAGLILKNKKNKVEDFAFLSIRVNGEKYIKNIALKNDFFKKAAPAEGRVILSEKAPDYKLQVEILDNYERVISKKSYDANNKDLIFSLPHERGLSIINTVRAKLLDKNGKTVSASQRKYSISDLRPPKDEMRTVLWCLVSTNPFYSLPVLKYWKDRGIDTYYVWFNKWSPLANMWHIEILDRLADRGSDFVRETKRGSNGEARNPCLNNPDYIAGLKKRYQEKVKKLKGYSVSEFTLGDECHLTSGKSEVCFSKFCVKDFKKFIAGKYSNIENLNKTYGSSYKTFEEVEPMPLPEARKEGQIARWLDQRKHMDKVWTNTFKTARDSVQKVIPDARIGYEGSNHDNIRMWNLGNYNQLAETISINNLYYRPFDAAAWRSFFNKKALFGAGFFGGYGTPLTKKHHPDAQYMPWLCLFKGGNSFWIWTASVYGGSITAPDFSFYTYFEDALKGMEEIKKGLDKALIRSERLSDMGILYSPSSIYASAFLDSPVGKRKNFDNLTQIIQDIGYQPRVYYSKSIEKGSLSDSPPKCLFLMCAHCLSKSEKEEIKKYVKNGGILIADLQPGTRDVSGNLANDNFLSEIFGAKTGNAPKFKMSSKIALNENLKTQGKFMPLWYDPEVKLKDGKANGNLSGAPIIISKAHGKGQAILLNFNMGDYISTRKSWSDSALRSLFKNIFSKLAPTSPEVSIEPDISGLEITRFKNGRTTYITLLQDMIGETDGTKYGTKALPEKKESAQIKVKIKKPGHVYNARNGKYHGKTKEFETTIKELEGEVFAVLPYKVEKIDLNIESSRVKQGDVFSYEIKLATENDIPAEEHILEVSFYDPNGQEIKHYRKKLAMKGSIKDNVSLALNEKTGKWKVKVKDIASKIESSSEFEVIELKK